MARLHKFDYRIFLAVLLGGVFGVLLNVLLPIFARNPLFLLALPAAGAFFLFLVIRPKEMLIFLLVIRPLLDNLLELTKITVGGTQFSVGAGLNLAVIVLAVFMAFYFKGFPRKDPVVRWWIIYLLILMCAVAYSPYLGQAVRYLINQLTYFTMFLIPFFIIKSRQDFLGWLKILALSFVLPVLFADLDMIHGGKHYADAGNRVIGTFTHPNILAFYLVLGLTVCFYIFKDSEFKMTRPVSAGLKLLMLNMLVLLIGTKTRNAWIACFLGFLIYGFLKDKKLMVGLILLVPLSLAIPTVHQRVETIIHSDSSDYEGLNSFEWRVQMWQSSLSLIAKRPLQGYGLTSFKPMSEEFSNVGKSGAHNVYLELFFETGLFGFISFLLLFWNTLMKIFRNMREAARDPVQGRLWAIIVGYLISYILICSADNLLYYLAFNWYVWFFLGLAMVSRRFLGSAPSAAVSERTV
jgi:O-antigen ligase